jgi:hypothetical protein
MQINQLVIFTYVCRITENKRFTENTKQYRSFGTVKVNLLKTLLEYKSNEFLDCCFIYLFFCLIWLHFCTMSSIQRLTVGFDLKRTFHDYFVDKCEVKESY